MAKIIKVAIFFAVGIIILYLLFQRQDASFKADCVLKGISVESCSLMAKLKEDVSSANYIWIFLSMILFMITNVLRALRWKMMFNAIGYRPRMVNLFGTIMVNYLANLGVPRSGEVIRAGLISGYEDIPVEKVLGTIFTDRIFDVFMLALVLILAMIFGGNDFIQYLNDNVNLSEKFSSLLKNEKLLYFIVATALLGIILLIKYGARLKSSVLGKKITAIMIGFGDGVNSVKRVSSVPLFLFYTVAIWFIYYLMIYFAFFAFLPTSHLGLREALVSFVFGSLGVLIPTPGGMGSFHYLIGEALSMYGIGGADSFSFANIVFFSVNIVVPIIFGLVALIILPMVNKR